MSGPVVKGWCPGALRPMASGDGLLVRPRIEGGALSPRLARSLAECAARFGNGSIDLTSRGNLQIRGVGDERLIALQAALKKLDLLDEDADAETIRNIMSSPLAGLDPAAIFDIRPCVRALDARLRADVSLRRLPGKFGFAIDDGGRLPPPLDTADVAFIASSFEGGVRFGVGLGGEVCGGCAAEEIADAAARLAQAFLALRGESRAAPRRMAALVHEAGTSTIARAASLGDAPLVAIDRLRASPRPLGLHPLGAFRALGVGVPFGRLDADLLTLLANEAEAAAGELRLTPWRTIFVIGERFDPGLADRLARAGFVLDEDDPRRAVAACPGAPSCASASTSTHADGARLASLARRLGARGVTLHVSGCAKGCAHPREAPVTLVGRRGGYDLVLDGRAGDEPAASGLHIAQIEALMERLAATPHKQRGLLARRFEPEREE